MPTNRKTEQISSIYLAVLLGILFLPPIAAELLGILLSLKHYFLYFLAAVLVVSPILIFVFSLRKIVIFAVFSASLYAIHKYPWNSRKVFFADVTSLEAGMELAEVQSIMSKYMEGTGIPTPEFVDFPSDMNQPGDAKNYRIRNDEGYLSIEGSRTYRHSNDSRFNGDLAVLEFSDDRLVSKSLIWD